MRKLLSTWFLAAVLVACGREDVPLDTDDDDGGEDAEPHDASSSDGGAAEAQLPAIGED
jgi:hypothetical protein